MDWLTELLKSVQVSRAVAFAVFVTAAALRFGPEIAPKLFQPLPAQWIPGANAALVFSGALIAIWLCKGVWRFAMRVANSVPIYFRSKSLSGDENGFLFALGQKPDEPYNLDHVDYGSSPLSRLEVLTMTRRLASIGLVNINPYSELLVSLTEKGRKIALEIQREQRGQR